MNKYLKNTALSLFIILPLNNIISGHISSGFIDAQTYDNNYLSLGTIKSDNTISNDIFIININIYFIISYSLLLK